MYQYTRKITKIGSRSLGVTLPIAWLRYNNIEYGDKVEIIANGSIKINPPKNRRID